MPQENTEVMEAPEQLSQIEQALQSFEGEEDTAPEEAEQVKGTEEVEETEQTEEIEQTEQTEQTEETETNLEQLRRELEETRGELDQLRSSQSEESEETEEPSLEPIQFITSELSEQLLDDPQSFADNLNEMLNKVYNMSQEFALKEVPPVVSNSVNRTMTINEKAKEFYKEHPELVKYKGFVGHVANKLSSKYSNVDKLFEETAKQAYNELNIDKKARKKESQRKTKPAFARKPGGSARNSSKQDGRTEQQKQIDGMLDTLN